MTAPDDKALGGLVEAASRGDRRAFAALYRACVGRVHAQVTRLLGGGPAVEDVVQDVFVEVHRSLPAFRGESAFTTWLFRVAHFVTISHLRRRSEQPVELDRIRELGETSRQPSLDARRQVRALYAALDQLSPEAREAFVLYELEGLTLRAIAELTDEPLNTVASRVRRTRERLRRLIDRQQGSDQGREGRKRRRGAGEST